MVARTSTAGDTTRQTTDSEQHRPVREAVAVLERLLKLLFVDPPSLDIITVENVVRRYPLTGLGAPALAAIEQSQRIVRARGDYAQAGLAEFHIGLIYLYWGDGRAAAGQFALARQSWSLVNDTPAICLAHYAQGLALYHAYHNESAMLQFSRAERMLDRPAIGAQAKRLTDLAQEMRPLLNIAQETLRESLWPREQPPADMVKAGYLSVPPDASAPAATVATTEATAPAPTTWSEDGAAGTGARRAAHPDWARRVPMPISNLSGDADAGSRGPVPGHITTDDRFGWYRIADKKGEFLPGLNSGTWLLADRDVDERQSSGREYIIIGSPRDNLGSITVQPVSHISAMPYCFLGYRIIDQTAPDESQLFINETGRPVEPDEGLVLAVVEGFWYDLNGHLLSDGG